MAEVLTRNIQAMAMLEEIKGLRLHPGYDSQSHQQFVDDTMLMGHSSVQEARFFKKCLTLFARD